jgi:siderophore synthetase component
MASKRDDVPEAEDDDADEAARRALIQDLLTASSREQLAHVQERLVQWLTRHPTDIEVLHLATQTFTFRRTTQAPAARHPDPPPQACAPP